MEFVELPPSGLSVEALAIMLVVSSADVIKELFMKGIMVTVNQASLPQRFAPPPLFPSPSFLSCNIALLTSYQPHFSQTLNKDQVKIVCDKYDVEVLEEDSIQIEARTRSWCSAAGSSSRGRGSATLSSCSVFSSLSACPAPLPTCLLQDLAKDRTDFIDAQDLDKLVGRPPVIAIMGHVDHGKTSLLDNIRKTRVCARAVRTRARAAARCSRPASPLF